MSTISGTPIVETRPSTIEVLRALWVNNKPGVEVCRLQKAAGSGLGHHRRAPAA